MNVQINGKMEHLDGNPTIRELLDQKGINPNLVACELNLEIIRRANLAETRLKEGDILEILQMVGGG
jgi:thiamine biosynthesis protein ThiS